MEQGGESKVDDSVEIKSESNLFKGTLVALSGSPMFEVGLAGMLQQAGLPREQLLTFVAPK